MASEAKPAGQVPTEVRSAQSFDGARLEYEVAGSGPPLAMLHGVLASRRGFSRQLAAFSERFRLIMLSARGHDGSEMKLPPNYGGGSSDVDDLCAVLESENIDRVSLVGHSSGGATAFVFASRYPDRMGRMVLIEPSLLGILLPADSEKLRPIFEGIVAEAALNGPVAGLRTTLAIMGGDAWAKLDEQEKASRLQPLAPLAPLVGPHFRGLLDLPVTEADIRSLRPPTLLVYGRASFPFERAIADRFAQLHPELELHTIEGAGHNVHRDRADVFNSMALRFLASDQ